MTNSSDSNPDTNPQQSDSLNSDVPQYDRGIAPAETAARKERESQDFGSKADTDARQSGDFDTRQGQTVDQEGLANNYAIEPEMYVNEPGDLKEAEEQQKQERAHELEELSEDEQGRLTMDQDSRHKGQGRI